MLLHATGQCERKGRLRFGEIARHGGSRASAANNADFFKLYMGRSSIIYHWHDFQVIYNVAPPFPPGCDFTNLPMAEDRPHLIAMAACEHARAFSMGSRTWRILWRFTPTPAKR